MLPWPQVAVPAMTYLVLLWSPLEPGAQLTSSNTDKQMWPGWWETGWWGGSKLHACSQWLPHAGTWTQGSWFQLQGFLVAAYAKPRKQHTAYQALDLFHSDSSEYIDKCFERWKTFLWKAENLPIIKDVWATPSNFQCSGETQQR